MVDYVIVARDEASMAAAEETMRGSGLVAGPWFYPDVNDSSDKVSTMRRAVWRTDTVLPPLFPGCSAKVKTEAEKDLGFADEE